MKGKLEPGSRAAKSVPSPLVDCFHTGAMSLSAEHERSIIDISPFEAIVENRSIANTLFIDLFPQV